MSRTSTYLAEPERLREQGSNMAYLRRGVTKTEAGVPNGSTPIPLGASKKPDQSTSSSDEKRQKGLKTLNWEELEPWQQDNHFIRTGYRGATNSYLRSLQSLLHIHNQTVNIWSHLLGALAFAAVGYVLHRQLQIHSSSLQANDLVLFAIFFAGLLACLTLSSAYHTFGNHSEVIRHSFLLGDLAGIVLLTMASFYPGVYYGFYCEPDIIRFYWAMVRTIICGWPLFYPLTALALTRQITIFGIGALIVCLIPRFKHPPWRAVRTAMLISMGLSGVLPMTHAAQKFGIRQASVQMGWYWYVGEGVCYVLGAIIYVVSLQRSRHNALDVEGRRSTDILSFAATSIESPRGGNPDTSIYGEARIRYSTPACCSARLATSLA